MTLYKSNPLAYPASRAAGFNPLHPAAKGIRHSSIAVGANHISLLTGRRGVVSGTVTGMASDVGFGAYFGSGGGGGGSFDNLAFGGGVSETPLAVILAAIVYPLSTGTNFNYVISSTNSSVGACLNISNGGALQLTRFAATNSTFNNISIVANNPYFLAVCDNGTESHGIAVNLRTGQMQKETQAKQTLGVSGTTYVVGASPIPNNTFQGQIAATMYSLAPLSMAQLAAWAADPWSFWYSAQPSSPVGIVAVVAASGSTLFAQACL